MPIESKYTLEDSMLFPGTKDVYKDGKPTSCPLKQPMAIPTGLTSINGNQQQEFKLMQPCCNKNCMHFAAATRKKEGDDKIELGYVTRCTGRDIWLSIEEKKEDKKKNLKLA